MWTWTAGPFASAFSTTSVVWREEVCLSACELQCSGVLSASCCPVASWTPLATCVMMEGGGAADRRGEEPRDGANTKAWHAINAPIDRQPGCSLETPAESYQGMLRHQIWVVCSGSSIAPTWQRCNPMLVGWRPDQLECMTLACPNRGF
jgi:hypothetical protein